MYYHASTYNHIPLLAIQPPRGATNYTERSSLPREPNKRFGNNNNTEKKLYDFPFFCKTNLHIIVILRLCIQIRLCSKLLCTLSILVSFLAVVADTGSSLSSRSEIRDSLLSAGDFRESYCTDDSNFAATSRLNNDSSKASHLDNDDIVIHLHGQEDTEGHDENEDDDDEGDDDEEEGGVGNDGKAAEKVGTTHTHVL